MNQDRDSRSVTGASAPENVLTPEEMNRSPAEILATETSAEFIEGMRNRMSMSYYKYGPVAKGFPHRIDAIGSLMIRLRKYAESGNTEFLIDAANFCMIEFMHPRHPEAKFTPTDSDQSPGRLEARHGLVSERSNREAGLNPNSKTAAFRRNTSS